MAHSIEDLERVRKHYQELLDAMPDEERYCNECGHDVILYGCWCKALIERGDVD